MENTKKIIGRNIKTARTAKGLTQQQLAEMVGVAYQNFYGWENGIRAPSTKYFSLIAQKLDTTVDDLSKPTQKEPDTHMIMEANFGERTPEDRERWLRNTEVLQRWAEARPEEVFWVPIWALERFCRENVSLWEGGRIDDISGLLKDYIEEGRK